MNREDKIEYLIDQLLAENPGYASIPRPIDIPEKKKTFKEPDERPVSRTGVPGSLKSAG